MIPPNDENIELHSTKWNFLNEDYYSPKISQKWAEVYHFCAIKNHEKSPFFILRITGSMKIWGPSPKVTPSYTAIAT